MHADAVKSQAVPAEHALRRARVPRDAIAEFSLIPGVGKAMAADLYLLGLRQVSDLASASPEAMFQQLQQLVGYPVDRCVLYVFRCCVYFAANSTHEPALLKWWNWKSRP